MAMRICKILMVPLLISVFCQNGSTIIINNDFPLENQFISLRQPAGNVHRCETVDNFNGENSIKREEWMENAPGDMVQKVIKFIFEVDESGKINSKPIFLNPTTCAFHWQYVSENFADEKYKTYRQIEQISYFKKDRKYIFGAFTGMNFHDLDISIRTNFQVSTQELLPVSTISQIQKLLEEAGVYHFKMGPEIGKGLDFVPTGNQKKEIVTVLNQFSDAGISVVLEDQQRQSVYTSAWGVGKLKYMNQTELQRNFNEIEKDTILLLDSEINDIPHVAGIISTEFLTPASHLVFLAQMYGIPLVTIPKIQLNGKTSQQFENYKKLNEQYVFIQTDQSNNRLEFVNDLTENDFLKLKKLKPKLELQLEQINTNKKNEIKSVEKLTWEDIISYGAKSVQMGVIFNNIDSLNRPELAVGIPIDYYRRHIKQIDSEFKDNINSLQINSSYTEVLLVAENIKKMIFDQPMIPDDLEIIYKELSNTFNQLTSVSNGKKTNLKLRSSSNVEDGEQFNGAGLYDSKGLCFFNCTNNKNLTEHKKKLEETIKSVWASLYNPKALWARRLFSVSNQEEIEKVGMGITVNPSIKDEIVNGVVSIRKNDYYFEVVVVESKDGDETEDKKQITHGSTDYGVTRILSDKNTRRVFNPELVRAPQLMNNNHYLELNSYMIKLFEVYNNQFPKAKNLTIEGEFKLRNHNSSVLLKQVRRIPQLPEIKLENNSKYLLLGGTYHFNVSHATQSKIGIADLYRPYSVQIKIPTLTSYQIENGNLIADEIIISTKNSIYEIEETQKCTNVRPKVKKYKSKGVNDNYELIFPCKAPKLGSIDLKFSYEFTENNNNQFRTLNSPLIHKTLEVSKEFEYKILPIADQPVIFELIRNDSESTILNSRFCQTSERLKNDVAVEECTSIIPDSRQTSKINSKLFFKFQMTPIYGKGDNMVSYVSKVFLFSKDKKGRFKFDGEYLTNPEATYVYQWLHDDLIQYVIDLPHANRELSEKLNQIMAFKKEKPRYLWAPLEYRSNPYFIFESNKQIKDLRGTPVQKQFKNQNDKTRYKDGEDNSDDSPRKKVEPAG